MSWIVRAKTDEKRDIEEKIVQNEKELDEKGQAITVGYLKLRVVNKEG